VLKSYTILMMSGGTKNERAKLSLPLNARTKLRDLLQNIACPGNFAGSLSLDSTTTPQPVISFRNGGACETLRFPLEKSTRQYDALVQVRTPPSH